MRQHGERVEDMMRDHPLRLANCGQVVGCVPLREEGDISLELLSGIRRQRRATCPAELKEAGVDVGCCRHAVRRSSIEPGVAGVNETEADARPRFKWTSSNAIAAGVIPEMRAAWPIVSGLC